MFPAEVVISGADVAALFQTDTEGLISRADREIIVDLLSQEDRVDLAVPNNIEQRALLRALEVCSLFYLRVRRADSLLKLLLGRILIVIQRQPMFYETRGFAHFNDFMSDTRRGLPWITGVSRAELYRAKAVATALGPTTMLEDVSELGLTKLQLIASVSEPGTESQRQLMVAARTDTIPELRERIAINGLVDNAKDIEWDALTFTMTRTQKEFIQTFMNNPQVQAYCGTASAGSILERMVQECVTEWEVRQMLAVIEVTVEMREP